MYADDILLLTNDTYEINTIQETFQNNSVLNFTQEININNKIPLLSVLIDTNNIDQFITSTYKKPTNINPCTLNFQSECPFSYKRAIIKTLISRAKLLSSSTNLKILSEPLSIIGFPTILLIPKLNNSLIYLNNPT